MPKESPKNEACFFPKDTLESISDRAVHSSTMIPMGKKAYMEGSLVHTNEIMVLLGDNWFAERSAKQAAEVAQRRIDKCTEMLEGLDKELALIEGWRTQAGGGAAADGDDGGVDIWQALFLCNICLGF